MVCREAGYMERTTVIYAYGKAGQVHRGEASGKNYYISHRRSDIHRCNKHEGYGITTSIYKQLKPMWRVDTVIIILKDIGKRLSVPIKEFENRGTRDELGRNEEQIFLHESEFDWEDIGI